jgi:hypothetical protein
VRISHAVEALLGCVLIRDVFEFPRRIAYLLLHGFSKLYNGDEVPHAKAEAHFG